MLIKGVFFCTEEKYLKLFKDNFVMTCMISMILILYGYNTRLSIIIKTLLQCHNIHYSCLQMNHDAV